MEVKEGARTVPGLLPCRSRTRDVLLSINVFISMDPYVGIQWLAPSSHLLVPAAITGLLSWIFICIVVSYDWHQQCLDVCMYVLMLHLMRCPSKPPGWTDCRLLPRRRKTRLDGALIVLLGLESFNSLLLACI